MINNRYCFYDLLGQEVKIEAPEHLGGVTVQGVVDDIYRDVIKHQIVVKIGGDEHIFREPDAITKAGNDIAFVYGTDDDDKSDNDDRLFDELREVSQIGGNIDDAIRNLDTGETTVMWLRIVSSKP